MKQMFVNMAIVPHLLDYLNVVIIVASKTCMINSCFRCGYVICGSHYKMAKLNLIHLSVGDQGYLTKVCLACLEPSSFVEDMSTDVE
jgi:hypothetical protein